MATGKTHIYLRRDSLTNWMNYNPILGKGEVAVVYNNLADSKHKIRIKVGDGLQTFKQLPYISDYDDKIMDMIEVDEDEEMLIFKN